MKSIKYLLLFVSLMLVNVLLVNAEVLTEEDLENSYIIGTHVFTEDGPELDIKTIMLAAKTIEGNSEEDMVIYFKPAGSDSWVDVVTNEVVSEPTGIREDNYFTHINMEEAKVSKIETSYIQDQSMIQELEGDTFEAFAKFTVNRMSFKGLNNPVKPGGHNVIKSDYVTSAGTNKKGVPGVVLRGNVKLHKDVKIGYNGNSTIGIHILDDVTIDLNGYKIEQIAGAGGNVTGGISGYALFVVREGATLTIIDSSKDKTGSIDVPMAAFQVDNNAVVNLYGGTIKSTTLKNVADEDSTYLFMMYGGTVNMYGGRVVAPLKDEKVKHIEVANPYSPKLNADGTMMRELDGTIMLKEPVLLDKLNINPDTEFGAYKEFTVRTDQVAFMNSGIVNLYNGSEVNVVGVVEEGITFNVVTPNVAE